MNKFSTPSGAAGLLLATVLGLFAFKVLVGVFTGSISIWAQAADSSLDIFAVVVTYLTVGYSARPADREHPFGHGKAEAISAGIQAVLLLGASTAITYNAIQRIISPTRIAYAPAGVAVMLVSLLASFLLSRHLFRVARATGSTALEANANNMRSDVYSTGAVLVGLAVISIWPDLTLVDSVLALLVVGLILRATYLVGRMAFSELVDVKLPEEEERDIRAAITEHFGGEVVSFHRLRTRKAGNQRYIDLHLVMPKQVTIEEAHQMCDHLEKDVRGRWHNTDITIHVEPCDGKCDGCELVICDWKEPKL
jgi:cation diffusion facilitator family transporter